MSSSRIKLSPMGPIPVAEIFYSIQGEGSLVGRPALFIRFGGCNLRCVWCDTVSVWRRAMPHSIEELIRKVEKFAGRDIDIVFTGGEPLLHRRWIEKLIQEFDDGFLIYQIETNGTIPPGDFLSGREDVFFNVSPKLSNSAMPEERRVVPEVLHSLSRMARRKRAIFKFVVLDRRDVEEAVETFIEPFSIPRHAIYLMPLSNSREEFIERSPQVVQLCKEFGFSFSPRLQLVIWNRRTGV